MIDVQKVSKHFGSTAALQSIDLKVAAGERIALIGHNGSGKTTLIRCLLGLHRYDGMIRVGGCDVATQRQDVLEQVGFVPQIPPALRFTVREYLEMARRVCGVETAAVVAVSSRLGLALGECWERPFRKLSGGMKQKLLVSVALARRPRILVLDEPTANLDPLARGQFFELLAEMPKEVVLLLSSHRVDELAGLVSRLIELDAGKIVKDEAVSVAGLNDSLAAKVDVAIRLSAALGAVVRGLTAWGLVATDAERQWQGTIGVPDQFRFLADLARWSGVLASVQISSVAEKGYKP